MSVAERLGPEFQAQLESFLAELRQDETIARWLERPAFKEMYERYENSVRSTLTNALTGLAELEGRHQFEDVYSRGIRDTMLKNSLELTMDACKRLMRTVSETMTTSFADHLSGAGLH
jgi:hypothetical protein